MAEEFTPEQIKRFEQRFAAEQQALLRPQVEHLGDASVQSAFDPNAQPNNAVWYDKQKGIGRPLNPVEQFVFGSGAGVRQIGAKVANLLSMMPEERVKQIEQEDQPFVSSPSGKAGKFAGELAITSPIGAASRALPVVRSLGPIAQQAIAGGMEGAVTAEPGDRMTGAAFGTAFGGLPELGIAGYKGLTRGMEVSPSAANLLRRDVDLTPGQMNPNSTWGMIEESLQRIPFAGPRVAGARERAWEQTRNRIAEEAAPPGYTPPVRKDVHDSYNDLKAAYNSAYSTVHGYPVSPRIVNTSGPDIPLSSAFQISRGAVADSKSRAYAQKFLDNALTGLPKGNVQSEDLIKLRSTLRDEMRRIAGNQNLPYQDAAKLIGNAEKRVTEALESQLPKDAVDGLRAIDAKYGNFKIFEDAIERAKDRPDGFTPSQFSQSVYGGTQSTSQYAGGGGRMRDISKSSADVFNPRQPATGASQPSQLFGYAVSPTAVIYGSGAGGKLARALLTGKTPLQEGIRDIEKQMKRKLSPEQRQALVDYLSAGSAIYGAEEKPFVATTKE